jgi:hypothetical protein
VAGLAQALERAFELHWVASMRLDVIGHGGNGDLPQTLAVPAQRFDLELVGSTLAPPAVVVEVAVLAHTGLIGLPLR